MSVHQDRLVDILAYVRSLQKKGVVTRLLPQKDILVRQGEVEHLPGVFLNTEEGAWVRVERQDETQPPQPPQGLLDWVDTIYDPHQAPRVLLKPKIQRQVVTKQVSLLPSEAPLLTDFHETNPHGQGRDGGEVLELAFTRTQAEDALALFLPKWEAWAHEEKPIRLSNTLYRILFEVMKDLKLDDGAEFREVVCGLGMVKRFGKDSQHLDYPILIHACEITMDEKHPIIEIRPADSSMVLETNPFQDVGLDMDVLKHYKNSLDHETMDLMDPFDPDSYTDTLTTVASRMAVDGTYHPNVSSHKQKPERLTIFNEWCFFVRERPIDRILKDLDALENATKSSSFVPPALVNLVDKSSIENNKGHHTLFRGVEPIRHHGEAGQLPKDLYFPLAYNDEQVSILQKLEANNGVVVQGPPGTGKSHTIANIICHYLAEGKTVLVTSTTAGPLGVLREKIPESIRGLTAALLSSDRESIKEFEYSIREIAERISGFDHLASGRKTERLSQQIDEAHQEILSIEEKLTHLARIHSVSYYVDGVQLNPVEIGKILYQERNTPNFLEGSMLSLTSQQVEGAVADLREARRYLLGKLTQVLPEQVDPLLLSAEPVLSLRDEPPQVEFVPVEFFPTFHRIVQAQQLHKRKKEIEQQTEEGLALLVVDETDLEDKAKKLADAHLWRQQHKQQQAKLSERFPSWDEGAIFEGLKYIDQEDEQLKRTQSLCKSIVQLHANGRPYDGRIAIDGAIVKNKELQEAIERLSEGQEAFGFFERFRKKEEQALLDTVLFDGKRPETAEQWGVVLKRIKHLKRLSDFLWYWNEEQRLFFVPNMPEGPNAMHTLSSLKLFAENFLNVCHDVYVCSVLEQSLCMELFGQPCSVEKAQLSLSLHRERKDLETQLQAFYDEWSAMDDYDDGLRYKETLIDLVQASVSSEYTTQILFGMINERNNNEQQQQEDYQLWEKECETRKQAYLTQKQQYDARRHCLTQDLERQKMHKENIQKACAVLEHAGAKKWANQCATTPLVEDTEGTSEHSLQQDPVIPDNWKVVWKLQCAYQAFDQLGEHRTIQDLMKKRHEAGLLLSQAYKDMIEERSWHWMSENSTPQVRGALQKYLNAVKKLGKGTGKRAMRHQKTARDAMKEAYQAIPCWIMPYQRVSESMPAQLGLFDLVVVDEASQADIQIMPALFRGKKFLIVGDDKQVSPSAVGKGEEEIQHKAKKFLQSQDFGHAMGPDQSIYDLFSEVFAGNDVMLREHFRSVRPIIEFSNREFYDGKIIPLRLPSQDSSLNPPLINILVQDGKYVNKANEAEARVIAEEIKALVSNPNMKNKTIGVVTLHSDTKQATIIRRMLDQTIDEHDYMRHDISVGPPPAFQGKERDIVFVSMTWDGVGRSGPFDSLMFEQRFNVALSRARDRMILVRSIENGHARPGGLLEKVLKHFTNPFPDEEQVGANPLLVCDTPLERSLAQRLMDLGYRVSAHVGIRGFRMDLVVEGDMGKRLAIGCDGDRPNEVDTWSEEMTRQRVLERAGWPFWRCFASHFEADPEAGFLDLLNTIQQLGIYPIGVAPEEVWVEHFNALGYPQDEEELEQDEDDDDDSMDQQDTPSLFGPHAEDWPTDRELLMSLCDPKSPPEKELLGVLLDMGYRVQPQYEARGYFIDFLVQGQNGKQLAIEYDGDSKYEDPDYLNRERERQHYLETVEKLTFWRVFHSDFKNRREEMIEQLKEALRQAGVERFDTGINR